MRNSSLPFDLRLTCCAAYSALLTASALAADYRFTGGNGQGNNIRWGTAGSWQTHPNGSATNATPGANDIAYFVLSDATAATVEVKTARSVGGIVVNRSGGQNFALDQNLTVTNSGSQSGTTTLLQNASLSGIGNFSTVNLVMTSGTLTMNGSGTGGSSVTGNTLVNGNTTLGGSSTISLKNLHINSGNTLTVSGTGTKTVSGRFSGSGTVSGNLTLGSGSTHSVGGTLGSATSSYVAGTGTQTITGTLTYGAGSIFAWDLSTVTGDPGNGASNQGSYDRVSATTLAGAVGDQTFQILLADSTFTDAFWNTNKTWSDVFSSTSGTAQSIFNLFGGGGGLVATDGKVSGQGQFSFSNNNLVWTAAVPETSTAMAGLLVAAGLMRRRRSSPPAARLA